MKYRVETDCVFGHIVREFDSLADALEWVGIILSNDGRAEVRRI